MGSPRIHTKNSHAIEELETLNEIKLKREIYLDGGKILIKLRRSLVKVVGEQLLINCYLDDQKWQALWGTGYMISLIDGKFLKQYFLIKVITGNSQ